VQNFSNRRRHLRRQHHSGATIGVTPPHFHMASSLRRTRASGRFVKDTFEIKSETCKPETCKSETWISGSSLASVGKKVGVRAETCAAAGAGLDHHLRANVAVFGAIEGMNRRHGDV